MATASGSSSEVNFDTKFESLNREIIETFDALFQALENRKHELLSRLSSMKAVYDKNLEIDEAIKQLRVVRETAVSVMTSNILGESALDPIRTGVDTQIRQKEAMKENVQDVNLVKFQSFSEQILKSIEEADLIELIPEYVGRENPIMKKCAWGSENGEIMNGQGIAFDKKTNEVYLVDRSNQRIQVFSTEGDFIRSFGHDLLVDGFGICLSDDNVYVTDSVNLLIKFNKMGKFIKNACSRGNTPGSFTGIAGLCFDGLLYVCEGSLRCIQIFDSELNFVKSFGSGVVRSPIDIKIHSDTIYILSVNRSSVYLYNKDLQYEKTIQLKGQNEGNLSYRYLAIDCKGNLITSNPVYGIHVFSPDGIFKHCLGEGHLHLLGGIALDSSDKIICVNCTRDNDCLQKY